MRRATLLYNPKSGNSRRRINALEQAADALREQGYAVNIVATEGPGTAGRQAAALSHETDILFACGGDGTIHEILQGIAFHPTVTLGIIPLGSANALARHLGIAFSPVKAVRQQISWRPIEIPVGKVTFATESGSASRYFLVMAGAGPDGALVYRMFAAQKRYFGRIAYYALAARLFFRAHFAAFAVSHAGEEIRCVSAMAVRVADLGGVFSPLIRGASIQDENLLLTTVDAPARLSLPLWFALSWARLQRWNPYVRTIRVDTFRCGAGEASSVQVQADGEWLGYSPMTVTLTTRGLRLLMPPPPQRMG